MRDDLGGLRGMPGRTDAGTTAGSSSAMPSREPPPDADIRRFRDAFGGGESRSSAGDAGSLPAGPFDLFRRNDAAAATQASAGAGLREQLRQQLSEMVTRLMVGDGTHAPRSVRMTLDDSLLPGVDLSVYEEGGFCVAHFSCRDADSFVQLAAPGPDMAVRMAEALGRRALWRIDGDALDAGGDWRRYVNAGGDLPLAEFRAQR